jgi:fumarylacetoacetase
MAECFPYGVFTYRDDPGSARIGVRAGQQILDLADLAARHMSPYSDLLAAPTLDPLLAAGPNVWRDVHRDVKASVTDGMFIDPTDVVMQMPFTVADYVDFYASEHHATNLGRILRPGQAPLQPNWRHQPVGYHGRSGTIVVSGTPVVRPHGQVQVGDGAQLRPTARLDVEAEIGFVIGVPSERGAPLPVSAISEHVFGVVVVNDWSARDVQAWETVPLGPFQGKCFLTSISPWVVPLDELMAARVPAASTGTALSSYLVETKPWGLDIDLEIRVNGEVVARPPYREMHWSPAQMLAHLTINGSSVRTGDLLASGTVSGPGPDQVGSLIELWHAERFLADGDEVVISATAPGPDGTRIDLGAVAGRVLPSHS